MSNQARNDKRDLILATMISRPSEPIADLKNSSPMLKEMIWIYHLN